MSRYTSAIPGMSVPEMRRSLAEVRGLLSEQNPRNPFNLQHNLSNHILVWQFVHQVAVGMHKKRAHNRKRVGNRAEYSSDDDK
jgi:hypothetical protein